MGLGGWRLVGQKGDVHAVHSELLLPELKAGVLLLQLCQGLLQLLGPRRGRAGAPKELSPQQVAVVLQESQVEVAEGFHMLVLHTKLLW